jgi:hypothetical protein
MTSDVITESFAAIRDAAPEYTHEIISMLERRMILAESLLALYEMGGAGYSRKVPELIPDRYGHLTLVDGAS